MNFIDNLIIKCQSLKEENRKKYSCYELEAPESLGLEDKDRNVFVDLAPTNKADEKGVYCQALEYATSNPRVQNIALTGPYGSGKSSVIQTFLTKYKKPVLQVSLAAFLSEESSDDDGEPKDPKKVGKKDIERSILQQMLYGADANKLPLSRFNRIRSPSRFARLISLLGLIGVLATAYLLSNWDDFKGGSLFPFEWKNWFNYSVLAISGLFLWLVAHKIYLQTFGISLKSVSLKNIELASAVADEASILNKHLDEIIYFFQSTRYDLVIFEDLDRFNDPSIFVTLREINGLVNANAGVKRKIRFLYAIRDDIFVNTERTKFFEFLVPVIPIVNHSNSVDKVLEQVSRQGLTEKLDTRFLSEVSRYLTDMRLIQSVFNEFAIYSASFADEGGNVLDPNKLLAILIYKNILPRDFEALHQQKGLISEVLGKYDESVFQLEQSYKDQVRALEAQVQGIKDQYPKNISELNSIYATALLKDAPEGFPLVHYENERILDKNLYTYKNFEKLISSSQISFSTRQQPHPHNHRTVDISKLQAILDPQNSYSERKSKIELKSSKGQAEIHTKIRSLKAKTSSIRKKRFHEVIQINESEIMEILSKSGSSAALLQYLIFNGYLDDTYYQYISLFHEGRMSPKDNKFLINIRGFNTPAPESKIDNPKEVIAAMREEDFSRSYILNFVLMDYLVENSNIQPTKLKAALAYISENFSECEEFFAGYYASSKQTAKFVNLLSKQWSYFAAEAVDNDSDADHIARILSSVDENAVINSLNKDQVITRFLSQSGERVFDQEIDFDLIKLTELDVRVVSLAAVSRHSELIDHLINESLYAISAENIDFVITGGSKPDISKQLATGNLTVILESGHKALIQYIKENYKVYFEEVFFSLETNTSESVETLSMLLTDNEITTDTKEKILAGQSAVFPSFECIPTEFYLNLLTHKTIKPSWENLLDYHGSDSFDGGLFTEYLKDTVIWQELSSFKIPNGEEAQDLRLFIFNNDGLNSEEYRNYILLTPKNFKNFPSDVSHEKLKILIEIGKVVLSDDSFSFLRDDVVLQAMLLTENFKEYLGNKEKYVIDDQVREHLIGSPLSDDDKYPILCDIEASTLVGNSTLALSIAQILSVRDFSPESFGFDYLKPVIVSAGEVGTQVLLLNKCHETWTKAQIFSIIELLPTPFMKIAQFGLAPKIPNNEKNLEFVTWLDSRDFISSFSETVFGKEISINTFKKKKAEEGKEGA